MSSSHAQSLAGLENKASDARVLNLRKTAIDHAGDHDLAQRPFFRNTGLNRAIVIKHHLRRRELVDFDEPPAIATKVILPLLQDSLKAGGKSFFIGQNDYASLLSREFGFRDPDELDLKLLKLLDSLVTFDPFILREHLILAGHRPADCYFVLPETTHANITAFMEAEVAPLISAAFRASREHSAIFARKLLSRSDAEELGHLRQAVQLSPQAFSEGVLGWKSLIYFKHRLVEVFPEMRELQAGLAQIVPSRRGHRDDHESLEKSRATLLRALRAIIQQIGAVVGAYDRNYNILVHQGADATFTGLLREAPGWASRLGLMVNLADHMVNFWRHNIADARQSGISAEFLATTFRTFDDGLNPSLRAAFATAKPASSGVR